MTTSLAKIQQKIAKLNKEAEALKAKEVAGVIGRIKEAIAHYDIAIEDLYGRTSHKGRPARTLSPGGKKASLKKAAGSRAPVPVKYRDDAGNTWTGRGNKPRWLVAALSGGKKIEDFAVKL